MHIVLCVAHRGRRDNAATAQADTCYMLMSYACRMHFPGSIIQPCNQFELLESCALIIEQSYGVVIEKGLEEAQTKAQVTS